MRNKIQAPGKQVLHKQVPKAQALQKEKDPRLVAVGGFGQVDEIIFIVSYLYKKVNTCDNVTDEKISSYYIVSRDVYGRI